ncbi:uncharacterized protein N7482_000396 [Penicillium canariense]|uniref:Uncharacterized protein n=1 Tax=Penicillium canariense TaxID=189055 RepID=A0A9W9IBH3_9EURO|nr:uncharacterized protein N7482_000396 [Penicillium canariense]KAJ5174519.1 hypothetical protein N7482_000396 [Penicillium canariense]
MAGPVPYKNPGGSEVWSAADPVSRRTGCRAVNVPWASGSCRRGSSIANANAMRDVRDPLQLLPGHQRTLELKRPPFFVRFLSIRVGRRRKMGPCRADDELKAPPPLLGRSQTVHVSTAKPITASRGARFVQPWCGWRWAARTSELWKYRVAREAFGANGRFQVQPIRFACQRSRKGAPIPLSSFIFHPSSFIQGPGLGNNIQQGPPGQADAIELLGTSWSRFLGSGFGLYYVLGIDQETQGDAGHSKENEANPPERMAWQFLFHRSTVPLFLIIALCNIRNNLNWMWDGPALNQSQRLEADGLRFGEEWGVESKESQCAPDGWRFGYWAVSPYGLQRIFSVQDAIQRGQLGILVSGPTEKGRVENGNSPPKTDEMACDGPR